MTPEIAQFDTSGQLVSATADDLLRTLTDRVDAAGEAHLCLTGGSIAARLYRRIGELAPSLDWSRVHLWWGDERWLPRGHAGRNDLAAREGLGEEIWQRTQRHTMPAAEEGLDLDAAASAHCEELGNTRFDLCLLGVGPDGHVASLFPGHPSSRAPGAVIPVRDSPKPPPERISLTHRVLNASTEVWLVVSGGDKAHAVAQALAPDSTLPAAHVAARTRTVWRLDQAAAGSLPTGR